MEKESREHKRDICYVKFISNDFQFPAYVRDISECGIKIESIKNFPWKLKDVISFILIPQETFNIPQFRMEGTIQWIKQDERYYSTGIKIIKHPDFKYLSEFNKIRNLYS